MVPSGVAVRTRGGFITLELSASLAVLIPIVTASLSAIVFSVHLNIRAISEEKSHSNLLRLKQLFDQITTELDAHRFYLPPIISKAGDLQTTEGEPNSINVHPNLAAKPDSKIITSGEIKLLESQSVQLIKNPLQPLKFLTCPTFEFKPLKPLSSYKSFLGLTPEGMCELTGSSTVWKIENHKTCWELQLEKVSSMWIPSEPSDACWNVTKIIPIDRIYSIYLSNQGDVRYLGHLGGQNIENQPILSGVDRLDIDLEFDHSLLRLQTTIKSFGGSNYTFSSQNHLARESSLNFTLNTFKHELNNEIHPVRQ